MEFCFKSLYPFSFITKARNREFIVSRLTFKLQK